MKALFIVLVLFFSSLVFAEDISDFEIEGMSIGESLLDYMSEEEIKSEIEWSKDNYHYKSKDFAEVYSFKKGEMYEYLSFIIKTDDRNFLTYGIYGNLDNNIEECLKIKKNIVKEFETIFPNTNKRDSKFSPSFDPSGKTIIYYTYFIFDTKDEIQIECFDYSKDLEVKNADGLAVSIISHKTVSWLKQAL